MASFDYESLGCFIFESLQKNDKNAVLMVDYATKKDYTYETVLDLSVRLAINLRKKGVETDDVIGFIAENSWKQIVAIYAGLFLGATLNPLNPDYTIGEILNIYDNSKPKCIFCTKKRLPLVEELRHQSDYTKMVVLFDGDSAPEGVELWDDFLAVKNLEEIKTFKPVPVDIKEHIAYILTSSGTTGLPKGVMLTDVNFRLTIKCFSSPEYLAFNKNDTTIVYVPFFHIYATILHLTCVRQGSKFVIMEKFNPKHFLEIIQAYRVTKLPAVPTIVNLLAKSQYVDDYDLSSLEEIFCGAAYLSNGIVETVTKRLNIVIRQLYGLTECGGTITLSPKVNPDGRSVGRVMEGVNVKTVPQEEGSDFGEICVKGENVMKGYLNNEKQTREAIDDDQWLHTGDLCYIDGDNNVFYVGRLKEIIKYKGFQVPPSELEKLLLNHPEIQDVGVIGKPDERCGELPAAFVVKKDNSPVTAQEIVDYVAENISIQKRLAGGVYFVEEIPKNPSGKILRRQLLTSLMTMNNIL